MDTAVKVINILGNVALVLGLFWLLSGVIEYFKSRKNNDRKGMDDGLEGILYGAIVGGVAKGIALAIVEALQGISF